MRTSILTLVLCVVSVFCFGQDSVVVVNEQSQDSAVIEQTQPKENHLIFKGMPIDGNIDDFVGLFINDGYKLTNTSAHNVGLRGMFAGQICTIIVSSTLTTNTVYSVTVFYGSSTTFYSAKSDYNHIVATYTKKYGVPTKSMHSFDRPYYEGDGYEDSAMRRGKVNYYSLWKLKEGEIFIIISEDGGLLINYEDAINAKLKEAEEQEHISYDI